MEATTSTCIDSRLLDGLLKSLLRSSLSRSSLLLLLDKTLLLLSLFHGNLLGLLVLLLHKCCWCWCWCWCWCC
jgi:hypothetical protein